MDDLMKVEEVSAKYGISVRTLRWWVQHGEGPKSFRLGHRRVYRRVDVESWIAAQYEATVTGGAA